MGPYGGYSERADRFIKHPGRDSLVVTNQLNWIVRAQCFGSVVGQRERERESASPECTYGLALPHQDGHKRESRGREGKEKGVGRGVTRIQRTLVRLTEENPSWMGQHRTFVFFVVAMDAV